MKTLLVLFLLYFSALSQGYAQESNFCPPAQRPTQWAQAPTIRCNLNNCGQYLQSPGYTYNPQYQSQLQQCIPNLYKMNDNLYRSAYVTKDNINLLVGMKIKTIVDFRTPARGEVIDNQVFQNSVPSIHFVNDGFDWEINDPVLFENLVVTFLQTVLNPENAPVLAHCTCGADRTGAMMAAYRMVVDGWTPQDSIAEMGEGCYSARGSMTNLVNLVSTLDVASVKKRLGIGVVQH